MDASRAPSTILNDNPPPPPSMDESSSGMGEPCDVPPLRVLECSVTDDDAPKAPSGEVTATMPFPEKRRNQDLVVQEGWYGSLFVRPLTGNVTPGHLIKFLKACEGKKRGAVYAALSEKLMANTKNGRKWLATVLDLGYKHNHYHRETGEQIWYKWAKDGQDMVPDYATAIEGGGVIAFKKGEHGEETLLVRNISWAISQWARPGGAVKAGESCLEAALRELLEETGEKADDNIPPVLLLSYNKPKARDRRINDQFKLFGVRAAGESEVKPDFNEIWDAQWFPVDLLVQGFDSAVAGLGENEELPRTIEIPEVDSEFKKFGSMELLAIKRFHEGAGLPERRIGGMSVF